MREEKELKDWKLVNFCEFDKYAIKSYCAIHGVDESLNLGDITKVNETKLEDFNMMTWGFPCTDISVAGKQKGFLDEDGNKTRSGMYYEGIRILRHKKPALSIIENVKNLTGKKFKKEFETVLSDLDGAGYNSYWKVLNAKDFGIPQNRERVFIVSIRKDLDNDKFVFPEGFDNGIRLKDVLEDEVDEKYYISDDKVQRFLTNLNTNTSLLYDPCQVKREGKSREYNDYCPTLTSRDYKDPRLVNENVVKQVGNISDCNGNWKNPQVGRIYDPDGCSPTLNTCGGGSHEPKIVQVGNVNPSGKGMNGNVFSEDGLAPTLTTNKGEGNKILTGIRIRKLTPKECFRLMGFSDKDFYVAKTGSKDIAQEILEKYPHQGKRQMSEADRISKMSNSQLYKQVGNSIVVDVLYYILVELYKAMPYLFDDLKLSSFFSGIGAFEVALDRLFESINTGNFTKPHVE